MGVLAGIPHWLDVFYTTYLGSYVVQSVLHSIVAAAVADIAILAWKIQNPATRQRFRILAIVAPAISYPLFTLLMPERGSVYFRLASVFDSGRWRLVDVMGYFNLGLVLGALLALTALVFVLQELLPIALHMWQTARHKGSSGKATDAGSNKDEQPAEAVVNKALDAIEGLPVPPESLSIVNDEYMYIFSSTGLRPRIVVSTALIEEFSPEQLRASMAHEAAHIERSRRPVLILVYVLRVLMFYNPIAMVEFRRIAQDEERICDDMAVLMTGEAEALAEALEMLRPEPPEPPEPTATSEAVEAPETKDIGKMAANIEQYSHDMLLRGRIARLRELWGQWEEEGRQAAPPPISRSIEYLSQFLLAASAALGISYYVL